MQKVKLFVGDFIRSINENPVDRWLLAPVKRRKIYLVSLVVLLAWQVFVSQKKIEHPEKYSRHETGFNHWWGHEFVYFYYYKKIFPLATTVEDKDNSAAAADELIKRNPSSLRMEWHHWARFGESARIWLYMPYCYITDSAQNPNINFINGIIFIGALAWLLHVFWMMRKPFLGLLLVFILGSSPFLMYENYINNNVFGLMGSFALILFCMHASWFTKSFHMKYFAVALLSGLLGALMYNIRAESQIMSATCLAFYFFAFNFKWKHRLALIAGFCIAFIFSSSGIQSYFGKRFDEAYNVVKQAGGTPFEGMKTIVHPLWHSLYCGLGDFDQTYSHTLHDTAVYHEILPLLRAKSGLPLKYPGQTIYEMAEYYDPDSFYYRKPETIDGYDAIAKEKFLSAIKNDPGWYAGILLKRIHRFFYDTSPVALNSGNRPIKIPFTGYLLLLLLPVLIFHRQWYWVKFLLFTLPLGAAVILAYYSEHNSYQSVYHFFTAALIVYGIVGILCTRKFILFRNHHS